MSDIQNTRRNFVRSRFLPSVAGVASTFLTSPQYTALASDKSNNVYSNAMAVLDANNISWTTQSRPSNESFLFSWSKSRYRSTTLSLQSENYAPTPETTPALYPEWIEGYWSVSYKFSRAAFPQGKSILSLRTAGAGLGTCLSLPNVGYNPPAHAARFLKEGDTTPATELNVYEDLAYNIPRKFEAFWPQSKVLSVQTNGHHDIVASKHDNFPPPLSPKCFVTGEGCTTKENPNLHLPASRLTMDFDGPTRRSGRLIQACDVSLVDNFYGLGKNRDTYAASKSFSQFNVNQDLQTFYREIISLEKMNQDGNIILGKVRIAAFLPKYIKALDTTPPGNDDTEDYDENNAVAIYDYRVLMKRIDEVEASSL